MDCNAKSNSSIDTWILNDKSELEAKKKRRHRRRCPHKREHNTAFTRNKCTSRHTNINYANKHISQKICVEKQDFQCIINLNTTVCGHKSKHRQNCDNKHRSRRTGDKYEEKHNSKDSNSNIKLIKTNKIVPECFRKKCHGYSHQRKHIERGKREVNNHMDKNNRSRQYEAKHEAPRKSRYDNYRCQHSNLEKKHMGSRLLSPISSSPLKDDMEDNLTYEDVSNTSLETQRDILVYYKGVKICKHGKYREKQEQSTKREHKKHLKQRERFQESKLDTLIRRTKERERKLVEQSRSEPSWVTSTPIRTEYSSGDFPMTCSDMNMTCSDMNMACSDMNMACSDMNMACSDMDISLNSESTLVLEKGHFAYSPSCPIDDIHSVDEPLIRAYSPSSPTRSKEYAMKVSESKHFKLLKIKNEPNIDIGAYSPIRTPDDFTQSPEFAKDCVKKDFDIKTEPLFSPKLSPIYLEKSEALQFCCKLESIKSESLIVD